MTTKKYIHTLLASALLAGAASTPLMAADRAAKLYKENCSNCHGVGGEPTSLGLVLHAKNLKLEPFKQGDTVAEIAKTLETGVPGTGMASFAYLSEADRLLVAEHLYKLRHGVDSVVDTSVKTVVVAEPVQEVKPVVTKSPVKVAPVAVETTTPIVEPVVVAVEDPWITKGRELYKKSGCVMCHGENGKADSPTGMALKARNFVLGEYKNEKGATIDGISHVLQHGYGVGMMAYPNFDADDRKALGSFLLALKDHPELAAGPIPTAKAPAKAAVEAPVVAPKAEPVKAPSAAKAPTEAPAKSPVAVAPKAVIAAPVPVVTAGAEDPLLAQGRALYKKNGCASCHGDNGQADSPMGKMINARNFVIGEYKMGATIDGISGVLQNGLPGTAMAAFPSIGADDRIAIATFLLALKGHPEVAESPEPKVASGSGKTSIAFAMSNLAETPRHTLSLNFQDGSAGADVYAQNCASCHGVQGQGGIATRMVSAAPYYRVKTGPLLGHDGDWMKEANFKKIVTEGTPGKLMPGMGTLTQQELSDLYSFFKSALEKAK